MSNNRSTTTARPVTLTERRELQAALQQVGLTREEELVLRLRHGIPAPKTTRLEFRGQDDRELSAKLALIEAELVDRLREHETSAADVEGRAMDRAIIDRLRKL